jgi:hypothetical protein
MLCYVMLFVFTLCYVLLRYVMLFVFMLCYVILRYVMLFVFASLLSPLPPLSSLISDLWSLISTLYSLLFALCFLLSDLWSLISILYSLLSALRSLLSALWSLLPPLISLLSIAVISRSTWSAAARLQWTLSITCTRVYTDLYTLSTLFSHCFPLIFQFFSIFSKNLSITRCKTGDPRMKGRLHNIAG